MIARLGIMGGMFDPVHNGHIAAARFAQQQLQLDLLKLVPCASPNHREAATADARHRLTMLQLATADSDGLEVDDLEIQRGGISYAVDTVAALRDSGMARQLVFVLGIDAFNALPQWHDWQRLIDLCHFYVLSRQGAEVPAQTVRALALDERRATDAEALFASSTPGVLITENFNHPESSTRVRQTLRANGDVGAMIDAKVHQYIDDNRLYR